jgi:hypothetical protein
VSVLLSSLVVLFRSRVRVIFSLVEVSTLLTCGKRPTLLRSMDRGILQWVVHITLTYSTSPCFMQQLVEVTLVVEE